MSVANRNLVFRPLRGGVAILNKVVNRLGTLGLIATSNGQDRWILSCYHVLCRHDFSDFPDGEPIFQPIEGTSSSPVAHNARAHCDRNLDIAAARIVDGLVAIGEILEVGPLSAPIEPEVGMRVIKSGFATGVTEAKITRITGDDVEIEASAGIPLEYEVSEGGDSGAIWINRESRAPVALHKRGTMDGKEIAYGVRINKVLEVLNLRPVLGT